MACSSVVRQLRGRVVAHSICSYFACPHTGPALERCGCEWAHQHHPLVKLVRNTKWPRLLKGSELRRDCLRDLFMDYPALQSLTTDPLWEVLSTLWDNRRHTDHLAETLHLKSGCLLPALGPVLMRRLCACPDWRNLGYVLALLGSTSGRFKSHRLWLRAHFLNYLILVCMTEPGCFVREPLYELLNELFKRGFFPLVDGWPSDFSAFAQVCEDFDQYGNWLRYRGLISGWDLYACTLFQYCWPDAAWLGQHVLSLAGPPAPFERSRRQARWVEVALKGHHRDCFSMGG